MGAIPRFLAFLLALCLILEVHWIRMELRRQNELEYRLRMAETKVDDCMASNRTTGMIARYELKQATELNEYVQKTLKTRRNP